MPNRHQRRLRARKQRRVVRRRPAFGPRTFALAAVLLALALSVGLSRTL